MGLIGSWLQRKRNNNTDEITEKYFRPCVHKIADLHDAGLSYKTILPQAFFVAVSKFQAAAGRRDTDQWLAALLARYDRSGSIPSAAILNVGFEEGNPNDKQKASIALAKLIDDQVAGGHDVQTQSRALLAAAMGVCERVTGDNLWGVSMLSGMIRQRALGPG